MKKILFSIVLLSCIGLFAQPRPKQNNTGAGGNSNNNNASPGHSVNWSIKIPAKDSVSKAKAQINAFWKQIEKMQQHTDESNKQVVFSSAIQSAKSSLNNTKMKDPSYNTAEMEKALAECEAIYKGLAAGKEELRGARLSTLKKLQMFFDRGERNLCTYDFISTETDEEKIKRVRNNEDSLTKYKQMALDYSKEAKDPVIYEQKLLDVKNVARVFQAPLDNKHKWPVGLKNMDMLEDPENSWNLGTFSLIQEVRRMEAYFYAANLIYPNTPEFIKAHEWCKKAVTQLGSTDDVLAQIKKSKADYLKKVKFPAAKVTDAALEADFKRLFNEMGYKETITKINIQSTDWVIDRNELTGVILGRSKQAFIATTTPDGRCYVTEFWIFQDYNGSGYGEFRNVTANSFRSEIACENIH